MDASDQAECAAKPGSGIEENKSDMVLPSVLLLVSSIFGGLTLPKLYYFLINSSIFFRHRLKDNSSAFGGL